MIWYIEHEEPLNGESSVRVTNLRGRSGRAKVQYFPVVKFLPPVRAEVDYGAQGYPMAEPEILDARPTFRPRP
jgi:hypothetical protein